VREREREDKDKTEKIASNYVQHVSVVVIEWLREPAQCAKDCDP